MVNLVRILRLLTIASLPLFPVVAFSAPGEIDGEWRGTSVCTNRQVAPACTDERVHYLFSRRGTDAGVVHADARKLIGATYESMGEMDFAYSTADDEWSSLIETPRVKARWSFRVVKGELTGMLVDQPTGAQVRKVTASRWKQ